MLKIFSILFLIWFIGSIIGMFYFASAAPFLCVVVFGQIFLIIGVLILISSIKKKRLGQNAGDVSRYGTEKSKLIANAVAECFLLLLIISIGILCIFFGYTLNSSSENIKEQIFASLPAVFGIILSISGIMITVLGVYEHVAKNKQNCVPVIATVVSFKSIYSTIVKTTIFYPVLKYYYKDKEIEQLYPIGYSRIKGLGSIESKYNLGQKIPIKINIDNPNEILENIGETTLYSIGVLSICMGIALVVATI